MKTNIFRTKCNKWLQRFIRLFSLTSVAFVVTACYGTPHAEYEVEGSVFDEDYNPLNSMQVVVRTYDNEYAWPDTIYTNEQGRFYVKHSLPSFGDDCLEIIVHDPDSVYESDSIHIASSKMKKEAEDSWSARYSVRADIQLKKKQ